MLSIKLASYQLYFKDRNLYKIVRDKYVDKIDEIFNIKYTKVIPRNERGRITVFYTPIVPFRRVCNFFEILEKNGRNINLVVIGESYGRLASPFQISIKVYVYYRTFGERIGKRFTIPSNQET